MAKRKIRKGSRNDTAEVLTDLLIVQLGVAGIPQRTIRGIVGCSIDRVNRIVKHLKTKAKAGTKG